MPLTEGGRLNRGLRPFLGSLFLLNTNSSGGFWSVNRAAGAAGGSTTANGETTTCSWATAGGLFFVLLLVGKGVFLRPDFLVCAQVRHSRALGSCLSFVALGILREMQPRGSFCFSEFCSQEFCSLQRGPCSWGSFHAELLVSRSAFPGANSSFISPKD